MAGDRQGKQGRWSGARGPSSLLGAAVVVAAFVASGLFPLLTYSLTLAVFGLAHVAVEMRYVAGRFADRLVGSLLWAVFGLIAAIVGLRLLKLLHVAPAWDVLPVELGIVGLLAGSVFLWRGVGGGMASGASFVLAAAVAVGIAFDPAATIVVLACLHNWTPVAFVAEATRGGRRLRWMGVSAVVFGVLPLLLLLGVPQAVLGDWVSPDLTVLPTGPLTRHLGAYVPWRSQHAGAAPWAEQLFSAVVFAQCMHYAAVLAVMPGLGAPGPLPPRLPPMVWAASIVVATLLLLWGYAHDFGDTRRVYAVAAAVHAWIELPVLLLALPSRSS